jgi:hypothetical protein
VYSLLSLDAHKICDNLGLTLKFEERLGSRPRAHAHTAFACEECVSSDGVLLDLAIPLGGLFVVFRLDRQQLMATHRLHSLPGNSDSKS